MFFLHFGDRFLLKHLDSLESVGIYSLAYKFGMMANVLVLSPFMMTWAPKRFEIFKDPDARETYSHIFTYFMIAYMYVSLGIAVLIKDVITIVSVPEYYSAYQYVPVILSAYIFYGVYSYVQFGVLLKKKTKYLGVSSLIVGALNIWLNFVLIPKYGIWGSALATILSFFLLAVVIYPIAQRLYRIPYQGWRLLKLTLMAVAIYFGTTLIDLEPALLSLAVKFVIAVAYPFTLYLIGFYTADELRRIGDMRREIFGLVKPLLGIGKKN